MLCKGFTILNFNPKKDNFFVMLHFTCTCIKFYTKSMFKEVDDARRTTDDGHITTLKAPLEHVVLR